MHQRICSECGCELSGTAAACPACGAPAGVICTECGKIIPFTAAACPGCGAPAQLTGEPAPSSEKPSPAQEQNGQISLITILALVFAIFLPPVGLILSIVGLRSREVQGRSKDKKKLKLALAVSIVLTIALSVFLAIYLPKAVKAYSTGKKISDFFKGLTEAFR